jgi:Ca2+-transporting ATPase
VNLDKFGQKLSVIILIFCGLLFGINVWQGNPVGDAFMFAVALAVAAIPEALSSIVTIVLAYGTRKMAREGAIIRKLQAVEGLGSVSVICSDKTGTLTQNRMTVEYYYVEGVCDSIENGEREPLKNLLRQSILCSDAVIHEEKEIGDPTETALLAAGQRWNLPWEDVREEFPRIDEVPFDSDRKLMSTLHKIQDRISC